MFKTLQSSVCILHPACILHSVCIFPLVRSLRFTLTAFILPKGDHTHQAILASDR